MKTTGIFLLLSLALCSYQGERNILPRSRFLSPCYSSRSVARERQGGPGNSPAGAETLLWPWAGDTGECRNGQQRSVSKPKARALKCAWHLLPKPSKPAGLTLFLQG